MFISPFLSFIKDVINSPIILKTVSKTNILRVPAESFKQNDLVLCIKFKEFSKERCPFHDKKLVKMANIGNDYTFGCPYIDPESNEHCGYIYDNRNFKPLVGAFCHCPEPCKNYLCNKKTILDFTS